MAAQAKPRVMTANRLGDGEVVYLTAGGQWSEALTDACVALSDTDAAALAATASAAEKARHVVATYLMDVGLDAAGTAAALSQRERIRAAGPTVHPGFGKQARGDAAQGGTG